MSPPVCVFNTMKLNSTPRHYMPLSQSQSDDDESGPSKENDGKILSFKNAFIASNELMKDAGHVEIFDADPKSLPMSPLRRIIFIFSLVLCVLFIVIFVFLVPCTNSSLHDTCHLTKRWKSVHRNMSYVSPLDFVHSESLGSYIVILGYSNDESGLIAIEGPTGKERWRISLHSTPTSSICNVIDVNSDGFPECIIIGNNGLLTAVDLKKGASLWYLHNHSDLRTVISVARPLLMTDCDNDDIPDLFIPHISNGDEIVYMAVVSGGTGQVIGPLLELPQCKGPVTATFKWKVHNDTDFILFCEGEENGNLWLLSSKSICDVALNETSKILLENVFRVPTYSKDTHIYKFSASDKHLVLVLNGNEIMLLEKVSLIFHVVWKRYLDNVHHIRILTDGQFTEGSDQLVILSSYLSYAKVIGLSLKDGKDEWTILQDKGNVTSALKLPKFFSNSDGLILKVVSSLISFTAQEEEKNSDGNSSVIIEKKWFKDKPNGSITQLKENYILVKPEKIPIVTVLNTEEIWSFCEENVCKPDVYTPNATVLISASKFGISVDMLAVSSTLLPMNNSVPVKEVLIKYWKLENVCYISRCTM